MHFAALLTLAAAIIPAVTAVPAPSPQSAEIDVHLELSSKDLADFFDEHKAEKKDPATPAHHDAANHAAPPPGQSLPYPFILKGHLLQGLEIIGPLPPTSYYQFPKAHLGEQGIISKQATTFKLHEGKLLIADKAVGLHGPFEKRPVPAVLVHPHQGLNFTAIHLIGSEITTLRFVDQRFTFLGPKFVSGIGDGVDVGLQPPIWPHPTIITWQVVRVGGKDDISEKNEEEFAANNNQDSYNEYDEYEYEQDVLAEI